MSKMSEMITLLETQGYKIVSADFMREQVVLSLSGQPERELSTFEKDKIACGQKIEAIKAIRERLLCPLSEAKAIVDAFMETTEGRTLLRKQT